MKTVKVRIAVAVDDKGNWGAVGNSWSKDELHVMSLARTLVRYEHATTRWLTAELPVPEAQEIAATVEEVKP